MLFIAIVIVGWERLLTTWVHVIMTSARHIIFVGALLIKINTNLFRYTTFFYTTGSCAVRIYIVLYLIVYSIKPGSPLLARIEFQSLAHKLWTSLVRVYVGLMISEWYHGYKFTTVNYGIRYKIWGTRLGSRRRVGA